MMTPAHPPMPTVELIPLQGAIALQCPTTLDLLVRITPPTLPQKSDRAPLNLSLVMDRSGSMAGTKMHYARAAAQFAVENLHPSDRVSIILFDDRIETLVASTLATDKASILAKIGQVHSRGSTALHAGWVQGGMQVSHYLTPDQVNRVILLSDGQANVGETRPDVIANDVNGLAQRGISTTTLGIGEDYCEDLLLAMASSGDGNFFHIESPDQLPEIFAAELSGLSSTVGQRVSLSVEPRSGITVLDVLNDFEQTETGQYKLPNLSVGSPLNIVVRLQIPALSERTELVRLSLAWDDVASKQRQVMTVGLELPLVTAEQLQDFPPQDKVQEQVALLMAARARQEAVQLADRGDYMGASTSLQNARMAYAAFAPSDQLLEEQKSLEELEEDYRQGNVVAARKKAISQSRNLSRSGQARPRRPVDQ